MPLGWTFQGRTADRARSVGVNDLLRGWDLPLGGVRGGEKESLLELLEPWLSYKGGGVSVQDECNA